MNSKRGLIIKIGKRYNGLFTSARQNYQHQELLNHSKTVSSEIIACLID